MNLNKRYGIKFYTYTFLNNGIPLIYLRKKYYYDIITYV